jgi:hypothetical protein
MGITIFPKTGTRRGDCGSGFGTFSSAAFGGSHGGSGCWIHWLLLIELPGQMSNDSMFLCKLTFGFG